MRVFPPSEAPNSVLVNHWGFTQTSMTGTSWEWQSHCSVRTVSLPEDESDADVFFPSLLLGGRNLSRMHENLWYESAKLISIAHWKPVVPPPFDTIHGNSLVYAIGKYCATGDF
jgi:hypothetical protein